MRSRELAELLLRKARQDEFAMDKLMPDPDSPDELIGFHAQQAVEKILKSVLALAAVRSQRTHDLAELIELVRKNGFSFPETLEEVSRLNPFATVFRYEDLPAEAQCAFDRSWALTCVRRVRGWAESVLGEKTRE